VRTESSDLSNLQPAEYHADLVLFLVREAQKVLGVIVEVQWGTTRTSHTPGLPISVGRKGANLRARHHCPVCLVDAIAERLLTAQTLQEALGPLY